MPSFDPQNVAASIAANDTSLLNRPLRAFSAGSVFKVVLAAAAYESGLTGTPTTARVRSRLPGQTYRCALDRAHGVVNLRGALEQSCNTYFIELGRLLGAQRIPENGRDTRLRHGRADCARPARRIGHTCPMPPRLKPRRAGDVQLWSGGADRDAATNYSHDEHRRKRRRVQDTGLCTGNC